MQFYFPTGNYFFSVSLSFALHITLSCQFQQAEAYVSPYLYEARVILHLNLFPHHELYISQLLPATLQTFTSPRKQIFPCHIYGHSHPAERNKKLLTYLATILPYIILYVCLHLCENALYLETLLQGELLYCAQQPDYTASNDTTTDE